MVEMKNENGEISGRVVGEPEQLIEELTDAVALVLERIEDKMRERGANAAARANLPSVLWQGVTQKWRGVDGCRKDGKKRNGVFRQV